MGEQDDVSARFDALARRLESTRTLALALGAALALLIAWTIYQHVRKQPDTITLSSDDSTMKLSPYGISIRTSKTSTAPIGGVIVLDDERKDESLSLTPSSLQITARNGVAARLNVLSMDGNDRGAAFLTLETADAHVEAHTILKKGEVSLWEKNHHLARIVVDENGATIDGSGPPEFALGSVPTTRLK